MQPTCKCQSVIPHYIVPKVLPGAQQSKLRLDLRGALTAPMNELARDCTLPLGFEVQSYYNSLVPSAVDFPPRSSAAPANASLRSVAT